MVFTVGLGSGPGESEWQDPAKRSWSSGPLLSQCGSSRQKVCPPQEREDSPRGGQGHLRRPQTGCRGNSLSLSSSVTERIGVTGIGIRSSNVATLLSTGD
jgi:hypothetical protein